MKPCEIFDFTDLTRFEQMRSYANGFERKSPLALKLMPLAYVVGMAAWPLPLWAEGKDGISAPQNVVSGMEQEIQKRLSRAQESSALVQEGDQLMAQKDYAGALAKYRSAVLLLPDAPMVAQSKSVTKERFAAASVAYARQLGTQGRYDEANQTLNAVLDPNMLPDHAGAEQLKAELKDPERFNPAMTPDHEARVIKVKRLLELANGHIDLGDFDAAIAAFNQVLIVDRHNTAAQRGLEKCEKLRKDYQLAARDHTRAKAINAVNQAWETAVPETSFSPKLPNASLAAAVPSSMSKLRGIVFPRISFENATLSEVIQFVSSKARELDTSEVDADKRGLNFLVKLTPAEVAKLPKLTLELSDIPLYQLLDYIADFSGTKWKLADGLVSITTVANAGGKMNVRIFSVPPGFLSGAPAAETTASTDPFAAPDPDAAGKLAVTKVSAQNFLEASGVPFPAGASANFDRGSSRLIVTNTDENLEIVDSIVDQIASKATKQARVKVTILRINETKLRELGLDILLGQFNLGSDRLFGSGGTYGNQGTPTAPALDYPFIDPTAGNILAPTGQLPLTGGLRSSTAINSIPTITDLIRLNRYEGRPSERSPGVFGIAGQFTDPQFQVVLRALNQNKGTDLMNSNEVLVKSGQIAKAESIREFIVPTDYDPAQIPQTIQGTEVFQDPLNPQPVTVGGGSPPVTPASPTTFNMRKLGNIIEVEATISDDGSTVDLRLSPEYTEFLGFINYGSTISTFDGSVATEVTRNLIVQPVFDTIRMPQAAVTVYDGNTLVIGGLNQSKVSEINDKVPFLGDIPIVGRLFRTEVKETSRTAIVIFVSVNVVDPAGRPFRSSNPAAETPTDR
jgi:general secretion pathway protein D